MFDSEPYGEARNRPRGGCVRHPDVRRPYRSPHQQSWATSLRRCSRYPLAYASTSSSYDRRDSSSPPDVAPSSLRDLPPMRPRKSEGPGNVWVWESPPLAWVTGYVTRNFGTRSRTRTDDLRTTSPIAIIPHNPSLSRCVPMRPGPGPLSFQGLDEVGLSGDAPGPICWTESGRNWPFLPSACSEDEPRGLDVKRLLTARDSYARLDRGFESDQILGSLK